MYTTQNSKSSNPGPIRNAIFLPCKRILTSFNDQQQDGQPSTSATWFSVAAFTWDASRPAKPTAPQRRQAYHPISTDANGTPGLRSTTSTPMCQRTLVSRRWQPAARNLLTNS